MVEINDNVITIVRGDTLETPVRLFTKCGDEYIPAEEDRIRFALKSTYDEDSPVLVYKEIPNDTMILRLESWETKKLQARRKPYVYDVELTTADGYVDTFIRSQLKVLEEVE